jgi:GTP-binding protein
MKIKSAEFETSAPDLRSAPRWALPEFALIGRSNVGKSSLLNALTGRRELARVSATPGKTQLLKFFVIYGAWSLVDLPGYGYAEVGRQRRLDFNAAVADFLSARRNLRSVLVLIDSRLPPQPIDLEFLQWLGEYRVPFALVFTKTDKQSATRSDSVVKDFLAAIQPWHSEPPTVLMTSAKTGAGCPRILEYLGGLLAQHNRSTG